VLADVEAYALAAKRKFKRPVAGLFLLRNEFFMLCDAGWDTNLLENLTRQGTARLCHIEKDH
jgi:hypothetical protein